MKSYRVTWEIDVDAENPVEAAEIASSMFRDPMTMATIFTVQEETPFGGGCGTRCPWTWRL